MGNLPFSNTVPIRISAFSLDFLETSTVTAPAEIQGVSSAYAKAGVAGHGDGQCVAFHSVFNHSFERRRPLLIFLDCFTPGIARQSRGRGLKTVAGRDGAVWMSVPTIRPSLQTLVPKI